MYYSIQPTQDKGQIGSTRQVAVPCRSAGDLYQTLADSNKQALTDHHATYSQSLMSLTACEKYKPLGVALTSLMSALYTQNYPEKQRQPNSNGLLVSFQYYSTDLSTCSRSLLACIIAKAWLQQEINSLVTPLLVQYQIYKHHALGPTALWLSACKSDKALTGV